MKLFKRAWKPQFDEIHQYSLDLQRITLLRDKCDDNEERNAYSDIIHVMQEVMIIINRPPIRL